MNELNEEIKLTLNLMQTDIDDAAHGELQGHLYSLLEIKRNELQQRLKERSESEPVWPSVDWANAPDLHSHVVKLVMGSIPLTPEEPESIQKTTDEKSVFFANKMVLTDMHGCEVVNTDWPNPLVNPDQHEPAKPLTTEELKTGGWWCEKVDHETVESLRCAGISTHYQWDVGRTPIAMSTTSGVAENHPRCFLGEGWKQIHRVGNDFYWS